MSPYHEAKQLEREIKRLQADLLNVQRQRKNKCKARKQMRQYRLLEISQELPEQIDIGEVDVTDAEATSVAWQATEEDLYTPGWLMLAKFSAGRNRWRGEGHFLAINLLHRQVVLDKYKSEDGCYSCGYGAVYSHDDIQETLGGRRPLAQVSCSTMAHRAEHHVDPSMTLRQLQHEDHDYVPLACLYTVYSWFTQTQILAKSAKVQSQWACRYYNQRTYGCIVKVQAMVRGWLFRHRVFYNPHSEIGRKRLLRGWHSLEAAHADN